MVSITRVLRYKRQAMVIAAALFVLALTLLSGNASLTPVGAAPTNQTPAQPTPTARPILLTDPVPDPKQAGVQYFPATGHTLRGAFLDYWNRYGGLAQFGYPLTEEFYEPSGPNNSPLRVQYFERNRFEHHPERLSENSALRINSRATESEVALQRLAVSPRRRTLQGVAREFIRRAGRVSSFQTVSENAGTQYEVLLGALGREFHPQDPVAPRLPDALYFPETGHNLSGVFRRYWEEHGGLFVHGYPITEQIQEVNPVDKKSYTVQYFERSRFELHPENAGSPYEVLLGLLGRQLSEKQGYPYGWYPSYGRAADYSWIAGLVELYAPSLQCEAEICGCVFLRHATQGDAYKQLVRPDGVNQEGRYKPAILPGDQFRVRGSRYVVFGRELLQTEKYFVCPAHSLAPPPGYMTIIVQMNPTR